MDADFKVAAMFMSEDKVRQHIENRKCNIIDVDKTQKSYTLFSVIDPLHRKDPGISLRITAIDNYLVYVL